MKANIWMNLLGRLRACGASSSLLLVAACGGGVVNPTATAPSAAAPSIASSSRSLPGVLHGGQAPITGSTLTLYAAGVPASAAPTTLATAYTDGNGNFNFQYTCPSPTSLIYVVASGGNAGGGANPAIELMAALGSCGSLPPFTVINELTTVAAVYALNAFSTVGSGSGGLSGCTDCIADADADMTQLRGNAPAINNSFVTAALLANPANGEPATWLPPAASCTGTSPPVNCSALGQLTALANSLAACVNSAAGSFQCTALHILSHDNAINTLQATLFIARNPGTVNIAGVYDLSTPNKVFSPGLSNAPTDWTIALNFTGGGLSNPTGMAIDGSGNVWVTNYSGSVTEFNPAGSVLSPGSGFALNGSDPVGIAIDAGGNVWTASADGSVTELNPTGSALSPAGGFTGGGLKSPGGIAIDGSGNVWVTNTSGSVTEFNPAGSPLSPAMGFTGGGQNYPTGIAIDGSGNVWVANLSGNSVTELNPAGSALSPADGFTGGGLNSPVGIAITGSGNVWVTNFPFPSVVGNTIVGGTSVTELNPAGSALSPAGGITGGGLDGPRGIAIDGSGNVWVANRVGNSVTELNPAGSPLSPAIGFTGGGLAYSGGNVNVAGVPVGIAIDGSGDVWVTNESTGGAGSGVTEFIGAAAPTLTPLVAQIASHVERTPPPPPSLAIYSIGGSLSGLASGTLVLQDNGGDNLSLAGNGSFTFATKLVSKASYSVTVLTQPAGQTCAVSPGTESGTVGTTNVTSVIVTCTTNSAATYTVGGTVTGLLSGITLTLLDNGANSLTIITDGSFSFGTPIVAGGTYDVTATVNPATETCTVTNGSGTIGSANVTNVTVTCML
jgi:sugar lactone lactonase YvrE